MPRQVIVGFEQRTELTAALSILQSLAREFADMAGPVKPNGSRTGQVSRIRRTPTRSGGPTSAPAIAPDNLRAQVSPLTYELAVEAAGVGAWDRDLESDSVTICPIMARMLELPPRYSTLSSEEWRDRVLPEDLPAISSALAHALETDQSFTIEFRNRLPSGQILWQLARGKIIRNTEGKPVRITGVSIDITEKKKIEQALSASEQRFRLLSDLSPDGIFVVAHNVLVYVNKAMCRMFEVTDAAVLIGQTPYVLFPADQHASVHARLEQVNEGGEDMHLTTFQMRTATGAKKHVQCSCSRVIWEEERGVQVLMRDVTEQKEAEERLRLLSERLNFVVGKIGEALWDWDIRTGSFTFSGELQKILLGPETKASGTAEEWRDCIHPDDLDRVWNAFHAALEERVPLYECEYRIRTNDGAWKWVWARGVIVDRDDQGKPVTMTGTLTDTTLRKEAEESVWRHGNLDALTGLPNRRLFRERLDTEVIKANRNGHYLAVLFLDLDGFKQVNDVFGHDAGDKLLVEATRRVKQCVRETDIVARLGGDEFTVVLTELKEQGRVEFVCQTILSCLEEPFRIGRNSAYVTGSIGVTLCPVDAASSEELIRKADQAMYAAKAAGKNQFSLFTQELDEKAHTRLLLSNELRRALSDRQLQLHYQPVVDLNSGYIAKLEALLRWEHPSLGYIQPATFVPLAEEAGLISHIGNWVFREAVECARRCSHYAGRLIPIGVNKSPKQFFRQIAEDDWLEHLRVAGMPGNSIMIEITEGALLHPSQAVDARLLKYRDAGVTVAIDDFGTGYSSMSYLHQFDIDYLKIDQSFVQNISINPSRRAISETIITMAHKLGLQVIAEGIETEEQMDILVQAGCDYAQGFLFSRAVPERQVHGLLSRRYAI